jgi:hypothetical protein
MACLLGGINMALKQPPFVNGEMTLTDEQIVDIKAKLVAIRDAFDPTDEQPVCDTFYITATYNKENIDFPINGDTCNALLTEQPVIEVV